MKEKQKINNDFIKGIGVGILIVMSLGFVYQTIGGNSSGSGLSKSNPSVLRKTQPSNPTQPSPPVANKEITLADVTTDDYILGDVNAPVTIVEYSDTECPFCKRFHPTMKQIIADNKGKVNWVYRHFPLTSLHPKAPKEAEAVECAGELGGNDKFFEYLDELFSITPSNNNLDPAQLEVVAKKVGLNVNDFNTCLDSGKYAQKVKDQYNDATNAGGRGTPYSIVLGPNGEKVPLSGAVPAAQVQATIDSLLNN